MKCVDWIVSEENIKLIIHFQSYCFLSFADSVADFQAHLVIVILEGSSPRYSHLLPRPQPLLYSEASVHLAPQIHSIVCLNLRVLYKAKLESMMHSTIDSPVFPQTIMASEAPSSLPADSPLIRYSEVGLHQYRPHHLLPSLLFPATQLKPHSQLNLFPQPQEPQIHFHNLLIEGFLLPVLQPLHPHKPLLDHSRTPLAPHLEVYHFLLGTRTEAVITRCSTA